VRVLAVIVLSMLALTRPAAGTPHKILVLPVDGTADAATRTKLTAEIARLANGLDGQVSTADATFADTALAVGCDPQASRCSDDVMATLGVDELVWGTATRDIGQTRLVVRRATKAVPTREVSTGVAASDSTVRIDAVIAPLFTRPGATPEPSVPPAAPGPAEPPAPWTIASPRASQPVAPQPVVPPPVAPEPMDVDRDRRVGVVFAVSGGLALVLGIASWASYASQQSEIDRHPTSTRPDFDDLTALEDRASSYAIAGDVLVLGGLAATGIGAYYLFRNHRRSGIAVTPAPITHGAGLALTILGGL
jgi:hypothetical protein